MEGDSGEQNRQAEQHGADRGKSDFDLAHGESGAEQRRFCRGIGCGPGIDHRFQRNAVDGLQGGRRRQRCRAEHDRQKGPATGRTVGQTAKDQQKPRNHREDPGKLCHVAIEPDMVGGIFTEGGKRIIRIFMHWVQRRADKKQHGAGNQQGRRDACRVARLCVCAH